MDCQPSDRYGMGTTLDTMPAGAPPTATQLAAWLSITSVDAVMQGLLAQCCVVATQYELGRLSIRRMTEQGFAPPDVLPGTVAQAMLMRARGDVSAAQLGERV